MHQFRDLEVWRLGVEYAGECYELTRHFPKSERYALSSQIQRSAVSIPANIAEGAGRGSDRDFGRFVGIALGSAYELETLLRVALLAAYVDRPGFDNHLYTITRIQRMLYGLRTSLSNP